MSNARAALFGTVPDQDYLGFWADQRLNAGEVVRFLGLKKADVAKVTGVSQASVRFDHKIPKEVLDRLTEIANVCELVAQHFAGDAAKTALWFKTVNPLLGGVSPRDTIRFGRYGKLLRFVTEALAENATVPGSGAVKSTREASPAAAAHS
jgi:hypothetical protein